MKLIKPPQTDDQWLNLVGKIWIAVLVICLLKIATLIFK